MTLLIEITINFTVFMLYALAVLVAAAGRGGDKDGHYTASAIIVAFAFFVQCVLL
jgi:hypothetical protein